jgi:flagellar protein FliS
MKDGFNAYRKVNTMGMSQLDLILTVYRGAIDYLKKAQADFENGRLSDGRTACEKARKCIVHLYTTLDMEKGEVIAARLGQLYAFMIQQIDLALASKSCKLIDEVIGLLTTIKSAWEGLKGQSGGAEPVKTDSSEAEDKGTRTPAAAEPAGGQRLTFSA